MSHDAFHQIVATLDYPLFVVTAFDGQERSGCLVGFTTQCSIDPRHWLVCVSKVNHTYRITRGSRTLVLHVLRANQHPLAVLFGEKTGDDVDKFARLVDTHLGTWRDGPDGVPVIDGCDWIAGPVIERLDLGDHEGQVLAVTASGHEHPDAPQYGYQAARNLAAGHPA